MACRKADRVRDDWGEPSFTVRVNVDRDRANLSGVTNLDVSLSSAAGMSGVPVSSLREGNKQIPIVVRQRMEERSHLTDLNSLYVFSSASPQRTPLGQIATLSYDKEQQKIMRRNQFRTVTVSAFPIPGTLPSEVLKAAHPKLDEFIKQLPPGYKLEIGGEEEEQLKGFKQLATIMMISVATIYLALVFSFKNAFKPLLVFAVIPSGMVGALASLWIMGTPFGFMGFLGIASLIGVIVSHVIVFFHFIEEAQERGEPLREALLGAGITCFRPVVITGAATVLGLIPLALHGGPLWEPLCYAQIGGLTVATVVTLILVPALYAVSVLDLKLVEWHEPKQKEASANG